MNTIKNRFRTKNLNLAAFLLASKKVNLAEVDKSNPREIYFVFENEYVCKELENNFWNDEASINPKRILYALSELKDQMFN